MRKSPSAETYKLLYVRSGNECAFPNCTHPIFNDDGLYISELCHIKAANQGGPRFDKSQTDEERRSPENLLFMCHRHHKETDEINKFSTEKLIEIKRRHESKYTESGKSLSNEMLEQINKDSRIYWTRQKQKKYEVDDLKMKTDFDFTVSDLFKQMIEGIEITRNYCDTCLKSDEAKTLEKDLKKLFNKAGLDYSKVEKVPYYENPFSRRNWEFHYIGLPNIFSNLTMKLYQLRVKTFEKLIKLNPENSELQTELSNYKKEFDEFYEKSYHVD